MMVNVRFGQDAIENLFEFLITDLFTDMIQFQHIVRMEDVAIVHEAFVISLKQLEK